MQKDTFGHRHLLGIEGLSREDIGHVLGIADSSIELSRLAEKKAATSPPWSTRFPQLTEAVSAKPLMRR